MFNNVSNPHNTNTIAFKNLFKPKCNTNNNSANSNSKQSIYFEASQTSTPTVHEEGDSIVTLNTRENRDKIILKNDIPYAKEYDYEFFSNLSDENLLEENLSEITPSKKRKRENDSHSSVKEKSLGEEISIEECHEIFCKNDFPHATRSNYEIFSSFLKENSFKMNPFKRRKTENMQALKKVSSNADFIKFDFELKKAMILSIYNSRDTLKGITSKEIIHKLKTDYRTTASESFVGTCLRQHGISRYKNYSKENDILEKEYELIKKYDSVYL
jgi:hypothetical protein